MIESMLSELKRNILSYSLFVKGMIEKSMKGLMDHDIQLLENVINDLESYANIKELEIDEYCISSIAQFQPKGKSLRQIIMTLKINNDLERIADHAVNIAESAINLFMHPSNNINEDIIKMYQIALNMFDESISSFSYEDPEKAISVCEEDNKIDQLNEKIIISFLSNNLDSIEEKSSSLSLLLISRNLERISDLATNIAEDVYYIVTGKVLKHQSKK